MIAQDPAAAGRPAGMPRPEGAAEPTQPAAADERAAPGEDFGAMLGAAPRRHAARSTVRIQPENEPAPACAPASDVAPPAASAALMAAAEAVPAPPIAVQPGNPSAPAVASATAAIPAPASGREGARARPLQAATVGEDVPVDATGAAPVPAPALGGLAAVTGPMEKAMPALTPAGVEPQPAGPPSIADPAPSAQMLRPRPAPALPAADAFLPNPGPPGADPGQPFALQPGGPIGWHLGRSLDLAPPDAPSAPAAAASLQPVVGQVAVAIARANEHRIEIRLDPPELGRVQIHLTPVDGGVQAVVLADRPETQDLLRRHAHALAQELDDAGFGSVSLDFAAGRQATPDSDAHRPPPSFEPRPFAAIAPPVAAPSARPAIAAGGLDVRL